MLIDLTTAVPHVLLDESPFAVIVRTQGKTNDNNQGKITFYSEENRTGTPVLQGIAPKASRSLSNETCYETVLPVGQDEFPRRQKNQATKRFEVVTISRTKTGSHTWRAQINVCKPKMSWLVSVVDLAKGQELFAMSTKNLEFSFHVQTPLERFKGELVPTKERTGITLWDRLREEI